MRVLTCTRAARSRGIAGRPWAGAERPRPGEVAYRAQHAARDDPLVGTQLNKTIVFVFSAGAKRVVSTPGGGEIGPGTAPRPPRERSHCARAARRPAEHFSRCERAAGDRAGRWRQNVATASASESRSARYESDGRPGSKPWTTSPGRESERRGSPDAHRHAHLRAARDRDGRTDRDASACRSAWPCTAFRPASSSVPASTARGRSPVAEAAPTCGEPATCSLTSCGCDQANGVTKQILIAQG